jgi:hypothetical protein
MSHAFSNITQKWNNIVSKKKLTFLAFFHKLSSMLIFCFVLSQPRPVCLSIVFQQEYSTFNLYHLFLNCILVYCIPVFYLKFSITFWTLHCSGGYSIDFQISLIQQTIQTYSSFDQSAELDIYTNNHVKFYEHSSSCTSTYEPWFLSNGPLHKCRKGRWRFHYHARTWGYGSSCSTVDRRIGFESVGSRQGCRSSSGRSGGRRQVFSRAAGGSLLQGYRRQAVAFSEVTGGSLL